jgi:hypothetical protein
VLLVEFEVAWRVPPGFLEAFRFCSCCCLLSLCPPWCLVCPVVLFLLPAFLLPALVPRVPGGLVLFLGSLGCPWLVGFPCSAVFALAVVCLWCGVPSCSDTSQPNYANSNQLLQTCLTVLCSIHSICTSPWHLCLFSLVSHLDVSPLSSERGLRHDGPPMAICVFCPV